ncbi:MAG TPA: nucleoside triphosphate pyrophosphohydrolase [Devosia sp.]|nr:nucleoside triphosphate pyrophosphohydrolase [Devosia sp.]
MKPSRDFTTLVEIMAALRDPETGCPWDVEQDFKSIRHFTIEEAYEVADAIERDDFDDLCSELGDLLLQPVFHAQMAAEARHFDIGDVIEGICDKLIRRHPHIFDTGKELNSGAVLDQWEQIKAEERKGRAARRGEDKPPSLLDDVPNALPALLRAEKLSKRAAKVEFDWPDMEDVLAKCREELDEVEAEIALGNSGRTHEELGDLLFAVANLARKAGVSPEAALSDANAKFVRRFEYVEQRCSDEGLDPAQAGLDRLQLYWDEIRIRENKSEEK